MKKIKRAYWALPAFLLMACTSVFYFSSCTDKFEELNNDKTKLTTLTATEYPYLFSKAQSASSYAFWRYQVAQNLFADLYCQYYATSATYFPSDRYVVRMDWMRWHWTPIYTEAVPQLKTLLDQTDKASAENALAKIMWVYTFHRVTDYYGPIPYFKAGEPAKSVPYDAQDKIYDDFFKKLAEATAVLNNKKSDKPYGNFDLIYKGDVNKWIKFANTLRLRLALRISKVDAARAKTEAEAAYAAGVMTDIGDDALMVKSTSGDDFNGLSGISVWNEFAEGDIALQDRLYINDGKGNFTRKTDALPTETASGSCVRTADIDGDGDLDIFVGGYVVPSKYPTNPESLLLINDGKGHFENKIATLAPELQRIGMVRAAVFSDLNGDKQADLMVIGEWMPLTVFLNQDKKLVKNAAWSVENSAGWWNCLAAADFDGDGDMDVVGGNLGLNTQLKTTAAQPMQVHFKDFDNNGSVDPIMTYFIDNQSIPVPSRDDLFDQLPMLKKVFTSYAAYSKATFDDLFLSDQKTNVQTLTCPQMQSCYFENTGAGFKMTPLSIEAQFSPIYGFAVLDANDDARKDLIAVGNNATTRVKFGRYRANHGLLLLNQGKGTFKSVSQTASGFNIRGDVRSMVTLVREGQTQVIMGLNNDKAVAYSLTQRQIVK